MIVAVERAMPVTSPAYDLGITEDELREQQSPQAHCSSRRLVCTAGRSRHGVILIGKGCGTS